MADSSPVSNSESRWLDPLSIMKLKSLELQIKAVVEGFLLGLHRSPFHGFSAEFTEYRPYVAGDDTRYLDWKLYARTDRHYIKKFREETNVRTYFLLDQSASMAYTSLEYTKLDYARLLAGSLGYFLLKQRDAVGACRFDSELEDFLPPAVRVGHLRKFLKILHAAKSGEGTELGNALKHIGNLIKGRSRIIFISDFLSNLESLESELKNLRVQGHEITLFQILDPTEISWKLNQSILLEDLENKKQMYVNGRQAAQRYHDKFQAHQRSLLRMCHSNGIRLCQVGTDQPLDQACFHFVKSQDSGWLIPCPHSETKVTESEVTA